MGCRPRRFGQRTGHSLGRRSPGSAVRDRTGTGRRLARCTVQADPDALHAAVFPGGRLQRRYGGGVACRGIGARGQRARFGRQRRFPGCGRFAGVGGFPDRLSGRPRAAGHHAGRILPFQALSPVSCFRIGVAIAESRRADGPLQPVRRHLPLRQMRFRREAAVPKCTQR